jgi:hypothetical protein
MYTLEYISTIYVYRNVMDAKNSAKTKIKNDFKQVTLQLEKLDQPISTEIILRKNKQDLSENIADRNRHSITCEAWNVIQKRTWRFI